jgi:phospholipid/cholesterol/gamma-HCH transport system substrate-binding protein
MNKEVKVGILGLLALVIFYFGFNFLKGSDLFSTVEYYYVTYDEVQGLKVSNPVTYNGVNVGRVLKMEPDYTTGKVKVSLIINENVKLSNKTEAILADDGLLGGKVIKLNLKSGTKLEPEGFLLGTTEGGMMQNLSGKIDPTLKNVDSLTIALTKIVKQYDQSGQALKILLAGATQSTAGVNGLLANNTQNIHKLIENADLLTKNLSSLSNNLGSQIAPILIGAKGTTDSLQKLQLNKTVNNLNSTIGDLKGMISEINAGKGTLGKLKNDDSLYVNMDRTAASLNSLLADMKANPKRYVHFSLFGRKEKK